MAVARYCRVLSGAGCGAGRVLALTTVGHPSQSKPSQAKPICRQVGSIIAPEIVYAGVADLNAAATATLFCDYPSLRPPPSAELSEMRALTAELREDVAKLHEVRDLPPPRRPQC